MKFMKQAFGEFYKFLMKPPQVKDSVYHMTLLNEILSPTIIIIRKHIGDMDVVNDIMCTRQSVITAEVIQFL